MILPDAIIENGIALKDQYFDLQGLSAYSALAVPTLRGYIRDGSLPCFRLRGKILIKKSEFDSWLEGHRINRKLDIRRIADEVMMDLNSN